MVTQGIIGAAGHDGDIVLRSVIAREVTCDSAARFVSDNQSHEISNGIDDSRDHKFFA